MLVSDLIVALKGAPADAKVEAWQPRGDDGEFSVTVVTYDRSRRTLCLLADASEVARIERVLHNDAAETKE